MTNISKQDKFYLSFVYLYENICLYIVSLEITIDSNYLFYTDEVASKRQQAVYNSKNLSVAQYVRCRAVQWYEKGRDYAPRPLSGTIVRAVYFLVSCLQSAWPSNNLARCLSSAPALSSFYSQSLMENETFPFS